MNRLASPKQTTAACHRGHRHRRHRLGHTLIELVMSLASATVLMAGLGAAVVVSSKAFRPESNATHSKVDLTLSKNDLLADLKLATGFVERSARSVIFLVPDRDGDSKQERLAYSWSGIVGDPLTMSYNNSSPIVVASNVRKFALDYATSTIPGIVLPAEQTGSQIVMLVNDSTCISASEMIRKSIVESWNFQVTTVGLNEGVDQLTSVATSAKAVYVCSTVDAAKFATVGPALCKLPIGILNEHGDLADDIGFAGAVDSTLSMTVTVSDEVHYITANNVAGSALVCMLPVKMFKLTTSPSPNLNSLATISGDPVLVTVDPGMALHDGRTAAGRRVMIPWADSTTSQLMLNNTGLGLSQRALEWATGLGSVSVVLRKFGYESIYSSSVDDQANFQIATRVPLSEPGKLKSISVYVGGTSKLIRVALYSDQSGEPGKLLAQSETGSSTSAMGWVKLTMPDTTLAGGYYWLALALNDSDQVYRSNAGVTNAGIRTKNYDGVDKGFAATWGSSKSSKAGAVSIFATFEPTKP